MMRGYALGLGAASQMVLFLSLAPLGTPSSLVSALMMGAAWAINLAVAEWAIRRDRRMRFAAAGA